MRHIETETWEEVLELKFLRGDLIKPTNNIEYLGLLVRGEDSVCSP